MMEGIPCWPYIGYKMKTLAKYGVNMTGSVYPYAWALVYEKMIWKVWQELTVPCLTMSILKEWWNTENRHWQMEIVWGTIPYEQKL